MNSTIAKLEHALAQRDREIVRLREELRATEADLELARKALRDSWSFSRVILRAPLSCANVRRLTKDGD
jgi:septal ring factor EnvC (AmiA/AmiB activator)